MTGWYLDLPTGRTYATLDLGAGTRADMCKYALSGRKTDCGAATIGIINLRCPNWIVLVQLNVTNKPLEPTTICSLNSLDYLWTKSGTRFYFLAQVKKAIKNKDQYTKCSVFCKSRTENWFPCNLVVHMGLLITGSCKPIWNVVRRVSLSISTL